MNGFYQQREHFDSINVLKAISADNSQDRLQEKGNDRSKGQCIPELRKEKGNWEAGKEKHFAELSGCGISLNFRSDDRNSSKTAWDIQLGIFSDQTDKYTLVVIILIRSF